MFMKLAGAATAVAATAWAATLAGAQTSGQFKAIKALAFDAYGTLFDVFSVKRLATSPAETGSAAVEKTIGIVVVAAFAASADGEPAAPITATCRRTSSAANAGNRSL